MQKILIFLFVNNKCYATQMHHALNTSLTPLQKALNRLEKGGLVTSYYEGKTRLYQFNPGYPLLVELEQLLKKAFTLLPAHEKKAYYVMKEDPRQGSSRKENKTQILLAFWEKLLGVTQLTFHAKTKSNEKGWNGKGQGEVMLTKPHPTVVIFTEKGQWQGKQGPEVSFSNIFRWTLDRQACVIALEHLRRGPEHPVFLFYLAPNGKQSLASVDSHLCAEDAYFGQIHFDTKGFRLHWRVIGPRKNTDIDYYYA